MKLLSLRCKRCGRNLVGFSDDLAMSCPSCNLSYMIDETVSEVDIFMPLNFDFRKGSTILLPFYLVRISDFDYFLPAYRNNFYMKNGPEYYFSVVRRELLKFEKAPFIFGVRTSFKSQLPLLKTFIALITGEFPKNETVNHLNYAIVGMPFYEKEERFYSEIYDIAFDKTLVEKADNYIRLWKDYSSFIKD